MRTTLIVLSALLALVAAVIVYLLVTTPSEAPLLGFPLSASQQALVARVPAEADAFAIVAAPAVLLRNLETNAVTRDAAGKWTSERPLPPAAMLGRADAVLWRRGKAMTYAVRFDPIRACIARLWTMSTAEEVTWDGRVLIVGEPGTPALSPPAEIALANGLPRGRALVVQRKEFRGAFPPMGRPAVTSVDVTDREILLASRAPADSLLRGETPPSVRSLPTSAMLAVAFTDPPRVLGDVDRLLAADLDDLVGSGGTIALYRVNTGTLLPRPYMAIAVPADERHRATLEKYDQALEMVGQAMEGNGELVVAFDRNSATQYLEDARSPMPWPSNRWALRLDPVRLVPVLRKVGDNPAVRWGTPRIHRGARDLRRWMSSLEQAGSVEAASSVNGGIEELRVRVASK